MFPKAKDDGSGTSCTNAMWNICNHGDGSGGELFFSAESNLVDDEMSSLDTCAKQPLQELS